MAPGASPPVRRPRLATLLRFGASLARRGLMSWISLAVSALTAFAFAVLGIVLARRGQDAPVHDVPLLASSSLAWGGGFLHAFSASASALRRDDTSGIQHLFVGRTASFRGYLAARVGGLALVLGAVAGGGTLFAGGAAVLAARSNAAVGRTLQATAAGFVFALAFACVLAPVALAALGARKRLSGYFTLLLLLVVPAFVVSAVDDFVPTEAAELCSVPTALAALKGALAPGTVDGLRFLRAVVALLVFASVGFFFVRREAILLERERESGS